MRKVKVAAVVFCLSLTVACENRPIQQNVEWVVRDAWDPVCAMRSTTEKFQILNSGWADKEKKVWVVDVKASFKPIKECFEPIPKLAGEKGASVAIVNAMKPRIRKKAFKSYDFEKKSLAMIPCQDTEGKQGWAQQQKPERCWTGPALFDETAGVKPVNPAAGDIVRIKKKTSQPE